MKARARGEVLVVAAPMAGWAGPLDEVPDAVFAEHMLGDGVALDPLSESLHAPFDGLVVALPKSRHAVTVRATNGAEVLMHVGLETVALGGKGFEAHVAEGQRVRQGDRLLSFDLDMLAAGAKSLLTPVVLTNGEAFEIVSRTDGREVAQGEPLLEIRARGAVAVAEVSAGETAEAEVVLGLPHGLHARPAARLSALASGFQAEVELAANGRRASARSPVSVMTLGVAHGQTLTLLAHGPDAQAAVGALVDLLSVIAEEEWGTPAPAPEPAPAAQAADGGLRGVAAAPGLAIGVTARLSTPEPVVAETSRGSETERQALAEALARVSWRLRDGSGAAGEIMAAHQALLADPELREAAERAIGEGRSAGVAWRGAVRTRADALRALPDASLAARADDLLDLERQVLFALAGEEAGAPNVPAGAIVLADELLPSQLVALADSRVAGFATERGGATSHVAILAAAMGVPALAAIGPALAKAPDGVTAILDADAGSLQLAPDSAAIAAAQSALALRSAERDSQRRAALEPGRMADGTPIQVLANLGAAREAAEALRQGAEGCGLFRTEFLYLDRREPPSEDEQAEAYGAAAEALAGRPLVIRTLDAGGDKPLAFAPTPAEANPALGLRGLRASLRRPDLLAAQFRAILRTPGERRILLPMVADLADLRAARAVLDAAAANLGARPAPLGVMIETPAAALLADQLAAEADFLSIGTNDLAQYVLAIDREHPELAARLDALHPAVLRLIEIAARAGEAAGKPVSVCGGLASEPLAAPLLAGLGVRGLSAAPAAIPAIKAALRAVSLETAQAVAREALALSDPPAVRRLLRDRFGDAR